MKKVLMLIAAFAFVANAHAVQIIGDPNAQVNGTLLQQTAATGYTALYTLQGTNDPGNGATRLVVTNPMASFYISGFGSTAFGQLAGAAGLVGTGSRVMFGGGVNTPIQFYANNRYDIVGGHMCITLAGNIGMGTATPASKLTVSSAATGDTRLLKVEGTANSNSTFMEVSNTQTSVTLKAYGTGAGSYASSTALFGKGNALLIGGSTGTAVKLFSNNTYTGTGMLTVATNGNIGIGTDSPTTKLDVAGEASVNVINIRGGSDVSEQFNIQAQSGKVEPGMVVAIDPARAGELIVSTKAYDRTVAGIISGAGGVKPGMVMGQSETLAYGKYPVALTGRVYCMVDATTNPVVPGDLLTTSNTPGHAMKVMNHGKAQGAIIGKAMTALPKGKGLVLVLVGLQ